MKQTNPHYVSFLNSFPSFNSSLCCSLQESKPDWRWQLTASGRFAHRKEYVKAIGEAHNLHMIHYEPLDGFRYERGVAVRGHAFVMQKMSNRDQEL